MGIVQRFERRLEGVVGDAFARVFGGGVVPQELEHALQREAAEGVRQLAGGHLLAPNSYTVTLSDTDHTVLDGEQQRATKMLARCVQGHADEQGWEIFGDVVVRLEHSPALHTGQFRTSSAVDPDASKGDAAVPSAIPGAAPMSQNHGYDKNRAPAGRAAGARDVQNGRPQQGESAPQGQGGWDQGGYPPQGYGPPRPGYDQGGWHGGGQPQPGYGPGGWEGNQQGGREGSQQGYYDQGYGQQPGYGQPGHDQGGYGQSGAPELVGSLHLEDGSARSYRLKQGINVIGRGHEAQFRLADTGVSRRHVEISWDGEVAMLTDLGSTNGTTVNGSPVQNWQLADGDVVRAGHSSMVVRLHS